jgi:hypothetical protein
MATRVRMSPDDRREVIIKAAVALTRDAECLHSWSRGKAGICAFYGRLPFTAWRLRP